MALSPHVRIWRLEAAFWSQFPGNFKLRVTARRHQQPKLRRLGPPAHPSLPARAHGNHWGSGRGAPEARPPGSPFHFNFHAPNLGGGDVGHTFICGPSGSGKTVVQNFMLAQLEKLRRPTGVHRQGSRRRNLRAGVRRRTYLTLQDRRSQRALRPLKRSDYSPAHRALPRQTSSARSPPRPIGAADGAGAIAPSTTAVAGPGAPSPPTTLLVGPARAPGPT